MKRDRFYIAYHALGAEKLALPCVGDEELVLSSSIAKDLGAELIRVVDMETELEHFYYSCMLEGFQKGWKNDIAEGC